MNNYQFIRKKTKEMKPEQYSIFRGKEKGHTFFFSRDTKFGTKEYCSDISVSHFLANYRKEAENAPPEKRLHLYETVVADRDHYEFYDFDIEDKKLIDSETSKEFFDRFIKNVRDKMKDEGETYSWRILESSTPKKRSLHVVNRNKIFKSGSMKLFVKKMAELAYPEEKNQLNILRENYFVDPSVYSRNRQMRMIGSSKFKKSNILLPAKWDKSSFYAWDTGFWDTFFITNIQEKNYNVVVIDEPEVQIVGYIPDTEEEEKIVRILTRYAGDIFSVSKYTEWSNGGGGYNLTRIKKKLKYCDICMREHQFQHQFATVIDGGVYLHCRSGIKGSNSFFLGKFKNKVTKKKKGRRTKKILDRYVDGED